MRRGILAVIKRGRKGGRGRLHPLYEQGQGMRRYLNPNRRPKNAKKPHIPIVSGNPLVRRETGENQ